MDEQVTTTEDKPQAKSRGSKSDAATLARCHQSLKRSKVADGRFRKRSAESIGFYFGDKQWDEQDKKEVEDRGQPAIVINRIKPTIKMATGLVVSQPLDWLAKPVGKNDDNSADTATAALKHIARLNHTTNLTAQVYWWALVYGVGWAYAGFHVRDTDPRSEPVQHRFLDPREIRVDPNSREYDLSDARFVIWSRKVDVDDAERLWPQHKERFLALANGRDPNLSDNPGEVETWEGVAGESVPHSAWKDNEDWNQFDKDEAQGGKPPQVVLHEMWERIPTRVWLMEHRDGWTHEFDPASPDGAQMLMDPGVVRYYETDVPKMHQHIFCGPLLLESKPSKYNHDRFPFIPCWYERDEHGDPVSMVESLKDPQREINHRRSRAIHELNFPNVRASRRLLREMEIDEDEAAAKFARGGQFWPADPGDIEVMTRQDLSSAQFQFMQDAKAEIQAVSGANDDLMGYDSSSKSGIAKQVTAQQGATMQRPNEANLRLFHQLLGEISLQLIQQAHTDEWVVRITDEIGRDKFITANQREVDPETGMTRILNDIRQIRFELEVDTMPWTPTTRERATTMLNDMAANEPDPLIRQGLRRMAVIASDWPNKAQILEVMDKAEQMAMSQMQGPPPEVQQAQQRMQDAQIAKTEAEAADKEASALQKSQQVAQGSMAMKMMGGMPGEVA